MTRDEQIEAGVKAVWAARFQDDLNPDFPMEQFPHAVAYIRETVELVVDALAAYDADGDADAD